MKKCLLIGIPLGLSVWNWSIDLEILSRSKKKDHQIIFSYQIHSKRIFKRERTTMVMVFKKNIIYEKSFFYLCPYLVLNKINNNKFHCYSHKRQLSLIILFITLHQSYRSMYYQSYHSMIYCLCTLSIDAIDNMNQSIVWPFTV